MKRRHTVLGLVALVLAPHAIRAQSGRLARVALVETAMPVTEMVAGKPFWGSLIAELRRLGYAEGKSVAFERWSGGGDRPRYAELAGRVVAAKPAVIVSRGRSMTAGVAAATRTIPIVSVGTIPTSLRQTLSRPGGNVTGVQASSAERQIYSKTAEILQAVTPKNARVAWFGPHDIWNSEVGAAAREGASRIKLPLELAPVATPINEASIRDAFARLVGAKFGGILLSPATEFHPHYRLIAELAREARLPIIGANRYAAQAGLLLSYGPELDQLWARAAHYVDRILKGANPAEMPIEQPSSVQLVVNLNTAKAIGIKVPGSLLVRADRVIE